MTLRERTFSAVRWTTIGSASRALLQVAQVAVLARLLAPEDYGLMAMVTVVLSFASLFSDFGVNSAFLQRRDVSANQRASLFWFNVLLSTVLMVLVIVMSPLLAEFFGDERLVWPLVLSSSTFFLGALGVQVRMAAEKSLQFKGVMLLEVVSTICAFAVAIAFALLDWGVYALIFGAMTSAALFTSLAWVFLAQGWRPEWRLSWPEVRPFLGFGSALVANNMVNQINLTMDLFLGGRMLSAALLGLYSVPRNLVLQVQMAVTPVVTRVAFPLIAEVQSDIARVRSIYLQTLNMTAATNAPVYLGMAFFSHDIVSIMLGKEWEQSAHLMQILALWGALRSTANPVGSLLLGMGRADLSLKWNLTMLFIIPPTLWLGSGAGPEGIAWALMLLGGGLFVPGWFVLVRPLCQVRLGEYCVAALKPSLIALLAIAPAYGISTYLDARFLRLLIAFVIAVPIYVWLSILFNRHWVDSMRELFGVRKK